MIMARHGIPTAEAAADPAWLSALEAAMAEAGALMAEARARTLAALQGEIDSRGPRPFPQASLTLTGKANARSTDAIHRVADAVNRGEHIPPLPDITRLTAHVAIPESVTPG